MSSRAKGEMARKASARSAAYGLLAEGFRYPDSEQRRVLMNPRHWARWPGVLARYDTPTGVELRLLRRRIASGDASGASSVDTLIEDFGRLFGHTVKGTCPPYEMEYGSGEIFHKAAELSDLRGFYSAFGLEMSPGGHERPDHITVECEFMSALAAKEAYAVSHEDEQGLSVLRDAQASFLQAHLGRWLPSFALRVGEAAPESFYGALSRFARRFVDAECRALNVSAGDESLMLRLADEREDTLQTCAVDGCGLAGLMSAGDRGGGRP